MITQAFLRGAIVFAIAGLITLVLHNRPAAARHNIWASALIIQLALFAFIPVLPPITLPVLPTLSVTVDEPLPAPAVQAATQQPVTTATTAAQKTAASQAAAKPRAIDWRMMLLGIWGLGVAIVLARYIIGTIIMARIAHNGTRVDDGTWLTLSQRIAKELGIKRPITLLWGDKLAVPVTWGILYPMILLPESAQDWTLERRHFVLVHEMAHVRRFDALTQLVAQITVAVFWFSPFVWLAEWRLRVEREHACDDVVLHHGTEATLYADELLQMVRSLMSRRAARPAFAALAMARRSEFEGRMLAILDPHRRRATASRGLMVAIISLLIAAPLAALNPVAFNVQTQTAANEQRIDGSKQSFVLTPPCDLTNAKSATHLNAVVSETDRWAITVQLIDPGHCVSGDINGTFTLSDDESMVRELGASSHILLREVTRDGEITGRIENTRDGGMTSSFTRNRTRISEEEGQVWIGRLLPVIMAEASYHVEDRVRRLLNAHGLIGTLETIERLRTSSSRTQHYLALIEAREWKPDQLARIWGSATDSLSSTTAPSDLDRVRSAIPGNATALWPPNSMIAPTQSRAGAGKAGGQDHTELKQSPEWLERTLSTFTSDGELHSALTAHVSGADKNTLLVLARAALKMQSDDEKSRYLIEASPFMLTTRDKDLENAWFKLANTLESSYERRNALTAAIAFAFGNELMQNMIAESASAMLSDIDKSAVLRSLSSVR